MGYLDRDNGVDDEVKTANASAVCNGGVNTKRIRRAAGNFMMRVNFLYWNLAEVIDYKKQLWYKDKKKDVFFR